MGQTGTDANRATGRFARGELRSRRRVPWAGRSTSRVIHRSEIASVDRDSRDSGYARDRATAAVGTIGRGARAGTSGTSGGDEQHDGLGAAAYEQSGGRRSHWSADHEPRGRAWCGARDGEPGYVPRKTLTGRSGR